MRVFVGVLALGLGVDPVLAEGHRPALAAISITEECLEVNDFAFEHSLRDGLAEADRVALGNVFEMATFECLGLSMRICEGQDESVACLSELAGWVREERAAIVARLPAVLESNNAFRDGRYVRTLERAGSPANEADCDHMGDADRVRYCEVVSEGGALEDAHDAWRMARREGVVDLEGHPLVDLELIR